MKEIHIMKNYTRTKIQDIKLEKTSVYFLRHFRVTHEDTMKHITNPNRRTQARLRYYHIGSTLLCVCNIQVLHSRLLKNLARIHSETKYVHM